MINPGFDGRVALITGANHGIGAATARALAAQGTKVFLTYYREPTKYSENQLVTARSNAEGGVLLYHANQQQTAQWVIDEIHAFGGTAVGYEMDLSMTANIPALFDHCERKLGYVDILINNHTYCSMDTFDPAQVTSSGFGVHLITDQDVDVNSAVNVRAYVLIMAEYTRRFLNHKGSWGRIVNLSTDAAHAHVANVSYAASKHAIESYSRSAAMELGKYGITVNIVAPGPIQTGYITEEEERIIARETPLQRVGRPDDVADVIVFLASDQARWLTGQLVYVGGGWRMHQ